MLQLRGEDLAVKEFECPRCGSKRFLRIRLVEGLVNWDREGGVEGHPRIEGSERLMRATVFKCFQCRRVMTTDLSAEMEREVL